MIFLDKNQFYFVELVSEISWKTRGFLENEVFLENKAQLRGFLENKAQLSIPYY
jgi:hypothetical protein